MIPARSKELAPQPEAAPLTQGCGEPLKDLPRELRKELATFARKLKRDYRALFASDPIYRKRAGQFLTALLPPKPRRRGRPGIQSVTTAIRLLRKFRLQYPEDRPVQRWRRIYPEAIPNYTTMSESAQADARQQLRERVRWRLRDRRCKPLPENSRMNSPSRNSSPFVALSPV